MVRKEIIVRLNFNEQKTSPKDIERVLNELAKMGVHVEVINYNLLVESVTQLLSTVAPFVFEAN